MALHFLHDGAGDAGPGEVVVLTGAEAHHAGVVRRLRVGEQVTVGDGRGTWLEGETESVDRSSVVVRVMGRRVVAEPSPRLVLVQALAKGDRAELAVQAATEIGADEIVPWHAARSVSRWDGAKAERGPERWRSVAREAAKQALRPWLAEVTALAETADLASRAREGRMLVLDPRSGDALSQVDLDRADRSDVSIVVGPEGGLDDRELATLEAAGARLVRLGESVLRTSTAGAAALAVVSVALGRW